MPDPFELQMQSLFDRANREKKWFRSTYQGLHFSPKELRLKQVEGTFRWGPQNWELVAPPTPVDIPKQVAIFEKQNAELAARISNGWE